MPVPTPLTTNAHRSEPCTGISGNVSRIPGKTDHSRYTYLQLGTAFLCGLTITINSGLCYFFRTTQKLDVIKKNFAWNMLNAYNPYQFVFIYNVAAQLSPRYRSPGWNL